MGQTIDAAAFWFLSLDKTCHAQLLVDAAAQGSGHRKTYIDDEEARDSYTQVGTPEKGRYFTSMPTHIATLTTHLLISQLYSSGWLAFQPYYDEILAKTNGSFLK